MPMREFGWFPVTLERPKLGIMWIGHAARYDDEGQTVFVDDDYQARMFDVGAVDVLNDQEMRWHSPLDEPVMIRPTRPDDAVRWDNWSLGIPLPTEIIGAMLTSAIPPPTVAAAVDEQGDVHTMILETGVGLYARYSGSWIRMADISPIEQLDIVSVPADDLDAYDTADQAGRTVNIRFLHPLDQPAPGAVDVTTTPPAATASAAATGAVVVNSTVDLPDAIAFGATPEGEGARWYIGRRAKALGWVDPLPWEDES